MNSNTILITRPDHDQVTNYLFYWSKEIIEIASKRGFDILSLDSEKAIRKNLMSMIDKKKPSFIYINGHGDYDKVCGHDNKVLLQTGKREKKVKTNIIYTLSCNCGKILGKHLVKNGVSAFIGYSEAFMFNYDKNNTCNPLNDNIANKFKKSSNIIPDSLLKGNCVQEAYDKSQSEFERQISILRCENAPLGSEHIIASLIWNKTFQTVIGDTNSKLKA